MSEILQKHIGSVFDDEIDLLLSIMEIYQLEKIQLDPMFNKGHFYQGMMPQPEFISDIEPRFDYVKKADARSLEFENNSINSMILDPPFLFNIHGENGIQGDYACSKRYGIFPSFRELSILYQEILHEAYRILKKKGVLIFKCQDYTDSKTTLTHCYIWQWAREIGFKVEDIAVLHSKTSKIYNSNTTQRHFRKHHCYFFVMIK